MWIHEDLRGFIGIYGDLRGFVGIYGDLWGFMKDLWCFVVLGVPLLCSSNEICHEIFTDILDLWARSRMSQCMCNMMFFQILNLYWVQGEPRSWGICVVVVSVAVFGIVPFLCNCRCFPPCATTNPHSDTSTLQHKSQQQDSTDPSFHSFSLQPQVRK